MIGNVLYILPRATEADEAKEAEIDEETGAGVEPLNYDGAEILWYGLVSIILGLTSIAVAVLFYFRSKRNMKTQITSALSIIVIIVCLLVFNLGVRSILPDGAQETFERTGGFGDGVSIGVGERVSQFTPENMGIFILVLLFSSVLFILAVVKVKDYLSTEDREVVYDDFEDDLSSTVDEAIKSLYKGKDVHSTVIRCYQNMCDILEDQGVSNDACITPRELQLKTIAELEISEESISNLTNLFEKGRYSVHKMDGTDRNKALKNLRKLKEQIQQGGSASE
ncbi:MAG: DUF4129 domain-containing protein [Candidatus Saliniplasma sp.]